MRILFTLAFIALSVPLVQAQPQDRSGLEIVGLEVKLKEVNWGGADPIVKGKPPKITPVLGRGTEDRHEPDIRKLERDRTQRLTDLRTVESKARAEGDGNPHKAPGYEFRSEMKNTGSKSITRFVWAYRASLSLPESPDKEFLCSVRIDPGKTSAVKAESVIPRQRVVSAANSGAPPPPQNPSINDMVINQVHFSDGTIWERTDWNRIVLTRQGAKKLNKGKCIAL